MVLITDVEVGFQVGAVHVPWEVLLIIGSHIFIIAVKFLVFIIEVLCVIRGVISLSLHKQGY